MPQTNDRVRFRHAPVIAHADVDVLIECGPALVAINARFVGELRVVGDDHPAFRACHNFRGIETERLREPESAVMIPAICTIMMPTVAGVRRRSISSAVIDSVATSISISTRRPPAAIMTEAVAKKVFAGTSTSLPSIPPAQHDLERRSRTIDGSRIGCGDALGETAFKLITERTQHQTAGFKHGLDELGNPITVFRSEIDACRRDGIRTMYCQRVAKVGHTVAVHDPGQ